MEEGENSEVFEDFPFSSLDVVGAEDDVALVEGKREGETGSTARRREVCAACNRPAENACLCDSFPKRPLRIGGRVIVLQHPHEKKRKLATVPLLSKCLDKECLEVLVGRKFPFERFPELVEVVHAAMDPVPESGTPLLVLYPGQGSRSLSSVLSEISALRRREEQEQEQEEEKKKKEKEKDTGRKMKYNLLAIDGTWQQAREMFTLLRDKVLRRNPSTTQVHWYRVKLDDEHEVVEHEEEHEHKDGSESDSQHGQLVGCGQRKGILRKEPEKGCVTTLEAVAGALGVIEKHFSSGEGIEDAILKPLLKMTEFQKAFNPAVRIRLERKEATLYSASRRTRLLQ